MGPRTTVGAVDEEGRNDTRNATRNGGGMLKQTGGRAMQTRRPVIVQLPDRIPPQPVYGAGVDGGRITATASAVCSTRSNRSTACRLFI